MGKELQRIEICRRGCDSADLSNSMLLLFFSRKFATGEALERYIHHSLDKVKLIDSPVNNIPCYQRAEHELKGPKTRVSNSC